MAVNIGPRIGIEGEQEYRNQMKDIIQQTRTLKSELKAIESGYSKNDSAMRKAAEKTKLLRDAIKDQKEHLKRCSEMVKIATEKYGEADKRTLRWRQSLADSQTALNRLNAELANNNAIKVWGEEVERAGEKVQQVGRGIQTVGDTLTKYVSAPIAAAGTASVKLASDYETGIAKLSTIADENEVPIEKMSEQIKALSDETGVGASDLAEATYQAISAGRSTAESVGFVANASKLAKAGFTDVTTSVDTLTTILNAYGLSADAATSISDKLVTTQNLGKTTVAQLGQSLGTVIPTAAAYGVNIDNVAAAYVAMTKNGVSTAEATTYLNSMINELGKSGTTASDLLKEKTGKSFHQLMDSGESLGDVLKIVVDAADEAGLELGDMFGNVRAGRAAMNIAADGAKEFNSALSAMSSTAGATEKAFNKVSGTTAAKFTKALNRIKNSGIEAGESILTTFEPAITDALEGVKNATSAFNNLTDAQKQNIVKWGAVAAAAGPAIKVIGTGVYITGSVVSRVGQAAQKIGELSAAVETAGGVSAYLSTSTLSVGLAAGAVVAPLAILGKAMWDAGQQSRAATEEQIEFANHVSEVSAAADAAAQQVDGVGVAIEASSEGIQTAGSSLSYFQDMLNSCYDSEGNLKEGMEQTANYALNELNAAMGTDYSTEFISHAESSKAALEEINGAIDTNISKLKEQAIQQAFEKDYAEALKAQTEARAAATKAQDTYTEAVKKQKEAVEEQIAASRVSGEATEETIERQNKAAQAVEAANDAVNEAGPAYKKAAGAAAEADAQVKGLEDTVKLLAEGTEESAGKAVEAYGDIGSSAEEAGQRARDAVNQTVEEDLAKISELRQGAHDEIMAVNNTPIQPKVDLASANFEANAGLMSMQQLFQQTHLKSTVGPVANAKGSAQTAWNSMNQTISKSMQGNVDKVNGGRNASTISKAEMIDITHAPMQGEINVVNGGPTAASVAHAQMVPIIESPMHGVVSAVNGAVSAAQSAWSAMQSVFNSPLQAVVNVVQNVTRTVSEIVSNAHHAEGGFVNTEQLSWLAEGNKPEVVIPLSAGKRTRALELYRRTGAILAESSGYTSSMANTGAMTNVGGLTVNVYGAQGQSEEVLADIVIDKINNMIGAK